MGNSYGILIVFLFVLSAFFSGTETAFFSLPRIYLKKLENSDRKGSKLILTLLRQPRRLLITILLGNTFVNMAISSLATLIALDIAENGWNESTVVTIQVILTTLAVVIFGEVIPKLAALATASEFARLASPPMLFFKTVFFPPVWLIEKLSLLISRKQSTDKHLAAHFTTEEFHNLIQSESSKHSLDEHEKQMLVGLFRFREAKLTEIYVPRVKVVAIEEKQSMDELRDLIVSSGFSRIPVYRETIDDIIGVIYVKDLLLYPEKKLIVDIMRPAWFVTENMKVQTLLNQFKTRKLQVAVVVDEYGGTSGIISLEDILEEIVGEIHDEYDQDEIPEIARIDETTSKVKGVLNIRQFNHEFGVEIDPEEFDNIAQFLLSQFNHVPAIGETYSLDEGLEFTVLDSDGKSIKFVQVTRRETD